MILVSGGACCSGLFLKVMSLLYQPVQSIQKSQEKPLRLPPLIKTVLSYARPAEVGVCHFCGFQGLGGDCGIAAQRASTSPSKQPQLLGQFGIKHPPR